MRPSGSKEPSSGKSVVPFAPGEKIYFTRLLEKHDKLKTRGLRRVRWTSPHPKDMTADLIETVATLKTQMPYIYLPVQVGSNAILKKMNRPYTREHYIKLIGKIVKVKITNALEWNLIGELKHDTIRS